MAVHDVYDPDCYGCQLRHKGIALAAAAIPSRQNAVKPRTPDPAWERGRAGEYRNGGTFMPYLGADMEPIPIKEFGEKRRTFEDVRRQQLSTL
jgi:hypothetical protein